MEDFGHGNESYEAFTARKKAERKTMLAGVRAKEKALKNESNPLAKTKALNHYKTKIPKGYKEHFKTSEHKYGWAGKVGEAHGGVKQRNQKAEGEKGYREDYR